MGKKKKHNICEINKCYSETYVKYYKHPVCKRHWLLHCEGKIDLKRKFNIKPKEPLPTPIKSKSTLTKAKNTLKTYMEN